MHIEIIRNRISRPELEQIAQDGYGEMVKGVIDIKQKVIALGGALHVDAQTVLIQKGSRQEDTWGISIYTQKSKIDRIAFSSSINVRPTQGNKTIELKDAGIQKQIRDIVDSLIE